MMQARDGIAACVQEHGGNQPVHHAGKPRRDHRKAEAERLPLVG